MAFADNGNGNNGNGNGSSNGNGSGNGNGSSVAVAASGVGNNNGNGNLKHRSQGTNTGSYTISQTRGPVCGGNGSAAVAAGSITFSATVKMGGSAGSALVVPSVNLANNHFTEHGHAHGPGAVHHRRPRRSPRRHR